MKLSVTTHGGWAGRFAPPQTIDTADLPPDAAAQGAALAHAAEAAAPVAAAARAGSQARAPEAQSYAITIDHGDRQVTVKASDADGDPACRALLDWVHAHLAR